MVRRTSRTVTMSDPKAIEPRDEVVARVKAFKFARLGTPAPLAERGPL